MDSEIKVCPWCGSFYRGLSHCQRDGQQLEASDGIVDRYRVVDRIGEGGMGAVYKAEHTVLGSRVVAIKLLHREHVRDQSLVKRFFREAKAASTIDNEHIVQVIDFGVTDRGDSFLVMEHIEGRALRVLIEEEAPLSLERGFSIGVQIAEGLYAAHRQGIVHRDLKPENVLVAEGPEGQEEFVKLLDFGIAQLSEYQDARITRAGMIIGTPAYMAPEQASGDPVDQRADIYALGTILYELLVGHCPFEGPSAKHVLVAQLTKTPVPPRQLRPDIPGAIERVILRALNKSPDGRPKTMMHLAYELRDALARQTGGLPAVRDDEPEALEQPESTAEIRPAEVPPGGRASVPTLWWASTRNLLLAGGVIGGIVLGVVVTLLLVRSDGPTPGARGGVTAPADSGLASDDATRSASRERPRRIAAVTAAKTSRPRRHRGTRGRARAKQRPRGHKSPPRPAVTAGPRTFIRVESVPPGANVYDGQQRLGRAPLSVSTAYRRTINVYRSGYGDRVLHVRKGQTGKVVARLQKATMAWEVLSMRQLKKMLADGQISRFTHDRRKRQLLAKRDAKLVKLRVEYKMGHWTKAQYERQVKVINHAYH